nr:MAG TPA: hypothetical protein [Bacteriophage sp.]
MNDLISKSKLKNELSKIPSEMGLIKKVWVMQAVDKQKHRIATIPVTASTTTIQETMSLVAGVTADRLTLTE